MAFRKGFLTVMISGSLFVIAACSKKDEGGMPPAIVNTAPVQTQLWQENVQATGTVIAVLGAQLKSEIAGRITKIYFKPGQHVRAGDSLLDINPAQLIASYNSAKANADLQIANWKRSKQLYRQKFLSRQDYETSIDNKNTAIAALNLAEANLAQAQIKAPFDGTVGINKVQVGDYVATGTPLVNLEQLDQFYADFSAPESLVGKVKIGDRVTLAPKDNSATLLSGHVIGIDTAIDENTRMFSLRALFDNNQNNQIILPGSFAEVHLFYGAGASQMVVPQEAVVNNGDQDGLYQVVAGHAKLMQVKLGERFADKVVVKSGIKPGDIIVVAGIVKVHEGMPVMDPAMMAAAMAAKDKSGTSSKTHA